MISESAGFHATSDVHGVTPDVILWFVSSNDSGNRWAVIQTSTQCTSYDTHIYTVSQKTRHQTLAKY